MLTISVSPDAAHWKLQLDLCRQVLPRKCLVALLLCVPFSRLCLHICTFAQLSLPQDYPRCFAYFIRAFQVIASPKVEFSLPTRTQTETTTSTDSNKIGAHGVYSSLSCLSVNLAVFLLLLRFHCLLQHHTTIQPVLHLSFVQGSSRATPSYEFSPMF